MAKYLAIPDMASLREGFPNLHVLFSTRAHYNVISLTKWICFSHAEILQAIATFYTV